jgi:hypothetical protein
MNSGQSESPIDALAATGSRRALVGATLAGALGLLTHRVGAAKPKHKKHRKSADSSPAPSDPPSTSPDPAPAQTVRGTVTQIFSSTTPIAIPNSSDPNGGDPLGSAAAPYPSSIDVGGFTNGTITDLKVHLDGFTHTYPADIGILLAARHLRVNATILNRVGSGNPVSGVNLVLDDAAPDVLATIDTIVSGTYRPASGGSEVPFPDPAPVPSGNRLLNTFQDRNPNGTWQLFISDGGSADIGSLGGWALEITAEVDLPAGSAAAASAAPAKSGKEHATARGNAKQHDRGNDQTHSKARQKRAHGTRHK